MAQSDIPDWTDISWVSVASLPRTAASYLIESDSIW
jgi:hypothetical protein